MRYLILLFILASTLFAQAVDLSSIKVGNRSRPLTNAKIKSITAGGITFICDQGLLQIPFEYLPPEFQAYKNQVNKQSGFIADNKTSSKASAKDTKPATTNTKPAVKVKTEAERAKEALARSILIEKLKSQIPHYENLISRYDKQSSFSGEALISSAENENNKAQLAEVKRKLAELGN